jgi:hypothetical protein
MRAHGIPLADPTPGGDLQVPANVDKTSPQTERSYEACRQAAPKLQLGG